MEWSTGLVVPGMSSHQDRQTEPESETRPPVTGSGQFVVREMLRLGIRWKSLGRNESERSGSVHPRRQRRAEASRRRERRIRGRSRQVRFRADHNTCPTDASLWGSNRKRSRALEGGEVTRTCLFSRRDCRTGQRHNSSMLRVRPTRIRRRVLFFSRSSACDLFLCLT